MRVVDAVRRRYMKVENRVRLLVCKPAMRETDHAEQHRCLMRYTDTERASFRDNI